MTIIGVLSVRSKLTTPYSATSSLYIALRESLAYSMNHCEREFTTQRRRSSEWLDHVEARKRFPKPALDHGKYGYCLVDSSRFDPLQLPGSGRNKAEK